jgi:hypothetical protein
MGPRAVQAYLDAGNDYLIGSGVRDQLISQTMIVISSLALAPLS